MYFHILMAGLDSDMPWHAPPQSPPRNNTPSNNKHAWDGTNYTKDGFPLHGQKLSILFIQDCSLGQPSDGKSYLDHMNYVLNMWTLQNTHLHCNAAQLDLLNYQQVAVTLNEVHHQLPPEAQAARQHLDTILAQPTPKLKSSVQHGQQYFNQQLKVAEKQAIL